MIGGVERLNKVLAQAGLASRRGADDLIRAGRVSVNGVLVVEPGRQVDPTADDIRFDDEPIPRPGKSRTLALYKPRGVITTADDPHGRPTVVQLVPGDERLFPIGRLDGASEGLIFLTNDGDLAQRLAHPRYGHEKEYRVKISGTPGETALTAWRKGMWLEDGLTAPARVRIESSSGAGTWLRFVLTEGRNRQLRRMIEAFHHSVHRLIRVRIGPVTLGELKPGGWRELSPAELAVLSGEAPPSSGEGSAEAAGRPRRKAGWARAKPPKKRLGRPARAKKAVGAKAAGTKRSAGAKGSSGSKGAPGAKGASSPRRPGPKRPPRKRAPL